MMPLEKKSQASKREREECEVEEELLWLPHLRKRESVVVESFRKKKKKKDGFYYKIATGHLCKKLQKCHRPFEQGLKSAENVVLYMEKFE
jgi:hypothetical protein